MPISFHALAIGLALNFTPTSFDTGNDLLRLCRSEDVGKIECTGYVIGIADSMKPGAADGAHACFPDGFTKGQARDVVINFIDQHPELRHYSAADIVQLALAAAFPCK